MYGLGCPSRDGRHDEQLPCLKGSGTLTVQWEEDVYVSNPRTTTDRQPQYWQSLMQCFYFERGSGQLVVTKLAVCCMFGALGILPNGRHGMNTLLL